MTDRVPPIPQDLLENLTRRFPDTAPRRDLGSFEFGRMAGRQEVLDFLRHHFENQEKTKHVSSEN